MDYSTINVLLLLELGHNSHPHPLSGKAPQGEPRGASQAGSEFPGCPQSCRELGSSPSGKFHSLQSPALCLLCPPAFPGAASPPNSCCDSPDPSAPPKSPGRALGRYQTPLQPLPCSGRRRRRMEVGEAGQACRGMTLFLCYFRILHLRQ